MVHIYIYTYRLRLLIKSDLAGEARQVEEEFRLCKNYSMTTKSDKTLISNEKLSAFFVDYFKEKSSVIQPEVLTPENYPHIIPPVDLNINSNIAEVKDTIKGFKNGKWLGTDFLYPEHLIYNESSIFVVYFMLLLTTILTTFVIPSSWQISSITCLLKNTWSRSEAENYRGLSIMSTCSKVLTSLVISRIRNAYEKLISNSQFGFRANGSTTDAIHSTKLDKIVV